MYKQNQNEQSSAYGKYYPEAYPPETLSLRGLIERVAFDQSVYSRDIVEGVIQKLTRVMVELLTGGQPVKWDGLGTFTPKIESVKGGVTEAQLKAGSVNIRDAIEGVHIRFIPENEKGEELTSRRMKDAITFTVEGVKILTKVGVAPNQKTLVSIESLEKFANSESSGGGSSTGSDTVEGYALTISTSGSGTATVTHDSNAVTSGSNLNEDDEVEISITPAEGETPTATINGSQIELTESEGVYTGSFAMPGQASSLVINTGGSSGGNGGADLDKD